MKPRMIRPIEPPTIHQTTKAMATLTNADARRSDGFHPVVFVRPELRRRGSEGRKWVGRVIARLVSLVAFACCSSPAFAWGPDAHHLVATLAERDLAVLPRAEIKRLLSLEPGATLSSISSEADDTRTAITAPWHYVNLPRDADCQYVAARDCVGGQGVVAAIETQARVLASSASDDKRLLALKYLVHLIADVHQPLHAAFADDRGGNRYQVQAFGIGTNLHAVWDGGLIENWPCGMNALGVELAMQRLSPVTSGPREWAGESCRIVSTSDFYPTDRTVGLEYAKRWRRTVVSRLVLAGQRLAVILNASLDSRR